MNTTEIKIRKLENDTNNPAPLLAQFGGQTAPQRAYIEFDCENKAVHAAYNPEVGSNGAVPMDVWHRRALRFTCPNNQDAEYYNDLMADLLPTLEKILSGYESVWDGSNYIGKYTDEAEAAIEEAEKECAYDPGEGYALWSAADWFAGMDFDSLLTIVARELVLSAMSDHAILDDDDVEEYLKEQFEG